MSKAARPRRSNLWDICFEGPGRASIVSGSQGHALLIHNVLTRLIVDFKGHSMAPRRPCLSTCLLAA
jgi:hypothetical protein